MLKSNQTLLNEISTVGNLAVKDGILSVVHKKAHPLEIYMYGHQPLWFMLVLWQKKGLEFLKYMQTVTTAASRGCPGDWVLYDEQYRLRKARFPA